MAQPALVSRLRWLPAVTADAEPMLAPGAARIWGRVAVLLLVVACFGLPINQRLDYALLVAAAIVIFCGDVAARGPRWSLAIGAVVLALALRIALAVTPIEEGHNVFLPNENGAAQGQQQQLPADVHAFLSRQFDAHYPPEARCPAKEDWCWRRWGYPDRAYAFSGDGIFSRTDASRTVTGIDFSDAVEQRLGFTNDVRYNWYEGSEVQRASRDRRFWRGLSRWQLKMPWYVMYRFPADYAGSQLCWRGDVLWENASGGFDAQRHEAMGCRALTPADIGKRVFAVDIKPGSLAMRLDPPAAVSARLYAQKVVSVAAALLVLLLLVSVRWRDIWPSAVLVAASLIVISVDDASLIGGFRPLDGGDDGLFYSGIGQQIAQSAINGDIAAALRGGESVYYYGGPGLRYFRALEMVVFGDTSLGYLSLLLLLPVVLFILLKRFLPMKFAWPIIVGFTALPIGELFGTGFYLYARWTGRGFADPASQILFVCGIVTIIGAGGADHSRRAGAMFAGALLLALSVFMKPIIAPMAGVILGALGLQALWRGAWSRLIAMCAGFSPFLLMPLHNWYFGRRFVLLSDNACLPGTCAMPPSSYLAAFSELAHGDLRGTHVREMVTQFRDWLSGASGREWTIPLNLAAVMILVHVVVRRRDMDPWLRLLGASALAEHVVALIYLPTPRYFYAMWLVTALVVAVFLAEKTRLSQWQPPRWVRAATPS